MNSLIAWWRAGYIKRLENQARYLAAAYCSAKARYENALAYEKAKEDGDE